jgi:hypothetical protein
MTEGAPRNKFGSRSVDGAGGTTSPASRNTGRGQIQREPRSTDAEQHGQRSTFEPCLHYGRTVGRLGHNCKSASFERANLQPGVTSLVPVGPREIDGEKANWRIGAEKQSEGKSIEAKWNRSRPRAKGNR